LSNAKDKLNRKHGDLIVMNNLFVKGAGFGHDTNVVTIIDRFGEIKELPKISKVKVADNVLDCLLAVIKKDTSCE